MGEEKYAARGVLRHYVVGVVGKAPTDRQREISKLCARLREPWREDAQDAVAAHKPIADGKWIMRCVDISRKRSTAITSSSHRALDCTEVHANGANMDDLEIHDERAFCRTRCSRSSPASTCPSLACAGVDVLVRPASAEVTGRIQQES